MSERNDALEEAAQVVDKGLIRSPEGEVEEHVNWVLQELASEIRALKRG
jgi:ribosomal protein S6